MKRIRHAGRVTVAEPVGPPIPHRMVRDAHAAGTRAVEQMRVDRWHDRLADLVTSSPEARAALAALTPEPVLAGDADPATCTHTQASTADVLPYDDPAKVWRCDACGLLHRWTDGQLVPVP